MADNRGEVWIYGVNGNVVHSGSYSGDRAEIDMSGIGDKILIVKANRGFFAYRHSDDALTPEALPEVLITAV